MATNSYTEAQFAQLYDPITQYLGRSQLDVWEFFAQNYGRNQPILEMGCGTGNNLLPLAKKGYSVAGLDSSAQMLEIFKHKVTEADLDLSDRVKFVLGDMVNPPIEGTNKFGLIIFGNSLFLHLDNDEQRLNCLKNTYNLLGDNGLLIISNRKLKEEVTTDWQKRGLMADGNQLRTKVEFNNGVYGYGFKVFLSASQQELGPFWWNFYPLEDDDLKKLIHKVGFILQDFPPILQEKQFQENSNRNIYLCKKQLKFLEE